MFEIIENHESEEVRELVIKHLESDFPDNKKEEIIEHWITHPLPSLKQFITEIIENKKFSKPLKAATYVMLDDIRSLNQMDPDFHHLDIYLRDVDPLLGSLLIQRVEKLKNPEINTQLIEIAEEGDETLSLTDRIRKRDFNYLWENILDYPLPFIVELIKIFSEESWQPVDQSGLKLFEILLEEFGEAGWYDIEDCKWIVATKKIGSKYIPLTKVDIERGNLSFRISQDLVSRPDRIKSQKFQSRGRFNLTHPELALHIYLETVRKSDFDGMIHIPIYSNNGVELAEFSIPGNSEKDFVMDEDGLYFSVKNRDGIISIDMDALASILLPVSRHSEMVNDAIPVLLERANEFQKLPLRGLNLLSTLHRGREFSLWDPKESTKWDDQKRAEFSEDTCQCTISLDIGNSYTKAVQVIKGTCEHEIREWKFPTLIYYTTKNKYFVGQKVIDEDLTNTTQTFTNIKNALKFGNRKQLRIQNSVITAFDAYQDYLNDILDKIEDDIGRDITSIAMTFPLHAPSGFEAWLRSVIVERGVERLELIDELTAGIIGSYRLHNQRGNVLMINIGSSQIGCVIANMKPPKSRKRLEDSRMSEDFEGCPEIIAKMSIQKGSLDISELIYENSELKEYSFDEVYYLIEKTKEKLSNDFDTQLEFDGNTYSFTLDPSRDKGINIASKFKESNLFHEFKILLRNILVKGYERGVGKDKLDNVLISGLGSHWPELLDYIKKIFPEVKVIREEDEFIIAKGVGLLANGQHIESHLDNDYILKVSKNGINSYETLLYRGEDPMGKEKIFEIRPHSKIQNIVVDLWQRIPNFYPDDKIQPMKDNENIDHLKASRENFGYDRILRKIVDIQSPNILKVKISSRGTLYMEIIGKEENKTLETQTSLI